MSRSDPASGAGRSAKTPVEVVNSTLPPQQSGLIEAHRRPIDEVYAHRPHPIDLAEMNRGAGYMRGLIYPAASRFAARSGC